MTLGVAGTAPGFRPDDISAALTEKGGSTAAMLRPESGRLGAQQTLEATAQGERKSLASEDGMVGKCPLKERKRGTGG